MHHGGGALGTLIMADMRFKAWRGLSDAYRATTEGHSPWTAETIDPEPRH